MVQWLSDLDVFEDAQLTGARHRSRGWLDETLTDPGAAAGWDALRTEYQQQAAAWDAWVQTVPHYFDALHDAIPAALEAINGCGVALEVGAGTGGHRVAALVDTLLVTDGAEEMLRDNAHPLLAVCDVRALPLPDASVDLIFGLNAVPHLAEFTRVLAPGGAIVMASSFREHTPLYVGPDELAARFGPGWQVTARRVASGDWIRLARS